MDFHEVERFHVAYRTRHIWLLFFALLVETPDLLCDEKVYGPPKPRKEFKEACIFLGIAKKGEALITFYFREEEWTPRGVALRAIIVPTAKFPFESGYRGFQKKIDYSIKKGKNIRVSVNGEYETFTLRHKVDIGDTLPILAEFISADKREELLPDDIDKMEFEVKDVSRWVKVPRKDLPRWSRSFEEFEAVISKRRRTTGTSSETRETSPYIPPIISEEEYVGRYVTLNGTYIFDNKTVYSPIIAVLDVGSYLEHTKRVSGGWVEVLYGEMKKKGYVLSVYLVDSEEEALRWERENNLDPITAPLGPTSLEEDTGSPDSLDIY
jgi:hypothetical protein